MQIQYNFKLHEQHSQYICIRITHQQADCQKAKVHPGVQRDPVETRQRRVGRGPCWPFPLSESSAQCQVQMRRWLKRLEHHWAVTNYGTEGQKQMIIRCVSKSTVADYGTSIILNVPVKVHKRGECTNLRALPLLRLRLEREEKLLLALT